ncbi:thioesterase [Streptacidiphilus sp. PB12-B1b]|uniref:thioesterase II family protein n=1 Tax=Streptacidiphilus sp. PB12-B1b TaxID=2705012 RepID=UPI0015FC4A6F|nr:alpha/beta fold hydrolase [Streptacidiphilus sp. PB12-B1b]QMU77045.1 thioesterase [Streptacidiphilus sp. PB12-B1b]
MSDKPDWIFPLRKTGGDPSARLLVFPYAAAGPSSLRPLVTRLPDAVEVVGVALPGRERRFGEPPATTLDEVVDGVATALAGRERLPTYLLGHSMGAGLALALALAEPDACTGIVMSGRKPLGVALGSLQGLDDDEVVSFLTAVGSTNPQLLGDAYWRNHLIQLFRHDTELDVQASKVIESERLSQRLLALGGADDPYVDPGDLEPWSDRTNGSCEVMIFPGDHFFLLDPANRPAVAQALADFIRP